MIAIDRFDILLPLGNPKSGSVSLPLIDNRLAAAERTCQGIRMKAGKYGMRLQQSS
jgi:hypothetical protein